MAEQTTLAEHQALHLSTAPVLRVMARERPGQKTRKTVTSPSDACVLDFASQFSPRGPFSPRTQPVQEQEQEIDDVFKALDEIMAGGLAAPASSPPGITLKDICEHEKSLAAPAVVNKAYAPGAAAAALRGSLAKRPASANPSDERMPSNSLSLRLPATDLLASNGTEHESGLDSGLALDSARTTATDTLHSEGYSECNTDMSQMTTPRAQAASLSGKEHVKIELDSEMTEPSTSKSNWLFQAAEQPLDQIDEDTDAELEMYREQQEMISVMCKMQADAFLRQETEKAQEEKREREQMQLMRIEQLQLIRIQEAKKREVLLRRQAANRPTSAPVRRCEVYSSVRGPMVVRTAHDASDDLNMSCCTETLSPGMEGGVTTHDMFAWDSPTRKVYTPKREIEASRQSSAHARTQNTIAAASSELIKAKSRPKSAISRLMSTFGTKRFRASVTPLPKSPNTPKSMAASVMKRMSFSSKLKKDATVAWAAEGIPIARHTSDTEDSV